HGPQHRDQLRRRPGAARAGDPVRLALAHLRLPRPVGVKRMATPKSSPRGLSRRFFFGLVLGLCLGAALGAAHALHRLWQQLPSVDHLADYEPILPLRIYARDGSLLAEYGEERRQSMPIDQIPLAMKQALLAIEDARFYEHRGVDYAGIARAALGNLRSGEHPQGGRTITMQLARTFFLSR